MFNPQVIVFVTVIFSVCLFSHAGHARPEVIGLRCENLYNPLGIDTPHPRLSWMLAPGERGHAQSAYQVIVKEDTPAAAPEQIRTLWDSGKVVSHQSSLVPYQGDDLVSGTRYYWQVRAWDETDTPSDWSSPAFFGVGPMRLDDWQGEWIGADWINHNEGPLPLLRRTTSLPEAPVRAMAYVCALGYYELYVNGKKVGDHVLSPAVSDYSRRGLFLSHDITPLLTSGNNCIGLWLGRGWSTAMLGKATTAGPLVKAQIEFQYGDGQKTVLTTGKDWQAHPSHITPLGKGSSGDYGGELVDAAAEIVDWSTPEYEASHWKAAAVHQPPTPRITAQMMEANRLLDEILPVSVTPLDDGYLVDMGRNYTGWFMLHLPDTLAAGERVEFEYADKRFPDSTFQTYRQRDTYVARGGGGEIFCNRFNYHAFRYALIKGLPRAPRLKEITGRLICTNYERAGAFSSDHPLLNTIYDTVLWTHRSLSLGGYTVDCPHRERLGYGGDSGTSMEAAMLNFRSGPFYAKWAADWRDTQAENGDVPYTAPNAQEAGGGPVWSGFVITMPWQTYLSYGDRRVLEKGWPVMTKWLAFIETKMEDGLLRPYVGIGNSNPQWSFLGDWVPPGRKQGEGRVDERSTLFFNNCYLVHCLQLASRIGTVLDRPEEAARYADQADALAQRLHDQFLNEDEASYVNGEQTYLAMPLLFDITPDTHRARVMAALEKDIVETQQGHLNAGMHGIYYMARHLIAERRNDLMTLMTTQETYPSYGYMLKNGATTIWEEWDGDNSQIHNTMLSIGAWFIAGLGGIQVDMAHPGFKHFTAAPGVESGLGQVEVTYLSEYGTISSAWQREGLRLHYALEVPPNSTASVLLPARDLKSVLESDQPPGTQAGIRDVAFSNNLFRCTVASGAYHFDVQLPERYQGLDISEK